MRQLTLRLLAAALVAVPALAQEQPRFRAGIDVTAIDATVVDQNGQPVTGLTASDFVVRIDNAPRKIVSAEWISTTTARTAPAVPVPEGFSSNESVGGGRLILIAVDEANLRFGGARAVLAATTRFLDALPPSDRVAAVGLGVPGGGSSWFTTNREVVKRTIERMTGRADNPTFGDHRISLGEAMSIANGDSGTLEAVSARECIEYRNDRAGYQMCVAEIQMDASNLWTTTRQRGRDFIAHLREVLLGLRSIDAPKTLVLISNGFVSEDTSSDTLDIGRAAAAARTSLYILRLERSFVDASDARVAIDPTMDERDRAAGLEMLAGVTRGALFNVTGSGETIFKRVASELAGYYLLAVESDARDKDGRAHQVKVDVSRRGLTVRARRQYVESAAPAAPADAQQALAAALSNPLPVASLPMRAIAFSLRSGERDRVQLLIHAEIGNAFTTPTVVATGFILTDASGRVVDTRMATGTLPVALPGAPSALVYVGGASVPPGEYMLKVAAVDGDRVGSVEHPIHAVITDDGAVALSDLVVGSTISPRPDARPPVSSTAWYGTMQAYIESYGSASRAVAVKYEVAADDEQPALVSVEAAVHPAGDERTIHTALVPVAMLPEGTYRLRAVVTLPGGATKRLSRAFAVPSRIPASAPAADEPSADAGNSSAAPTLHLPVSYAALTPPLAVDALVAPAMVNDLLDQWLPDPPPSPKTVEYLKAARVAPLKDVPPAPDDNNPFGWFVRGLAYLQRGDLQAAEENLKKAISDETDTTVPLIYVGATFAASGRDQQAASALLTALGMYDDMPDLYDWTATELMRIHDFAQARDLLEEAAGKWPADTRFARPLAVLYATLGRGPEALIELERHLAVSPRDMSGLMMAVRWYFELHAAGRSLHDDDAARAKAYADAYEKLGGNEMPLVRSWVAALSKKKP